MSRRVNYVLLVNVAGVLFTTHSEGRTDQAFRRMLEWAIALVPGTIKIRSCFFIVRIAGQSSAMFNLNIDCYQVLC